MKDYRQERVLKGLFRQGFVRWYDLKKPNCVELGIVE